MAISEVVFEIFSLDQRGGSIDPYRYTASVAKSGVYYKQGGSHCSLNTHVINNKDESKLTVTV